ncbi:CRISPR-associated endonuclease Cas1 [Alkalimarinus sediminis]|uniref:CRISPR-associated endonuclease Cas1 n=1 Tax=Alkalimarinus sediminis TaxID=1632866 RepID=A0A9E8HP96_9ALTE|nr:CRISPR-associated endonuclease Cas1 [Alkalimarinus sediminis]UZW76606.1 CRISPR-associated endonuclease Cas1 [Alkalimarinus sediminis]
MDIIIDRAGMGLRMETKHCLRIEKDGSLLQRIPTQHIDSVVLSVKTALESNVLQALNENDIPFVLLPGRYNKEAVQLEGSSKGSIVARSRQFRLYENEATKLLLIKSIVSKKCQSIIYAAETLRLEGYRDIEGFCESDLKVWLRKINQAKGADELRGIEGAISRHWFSLMQHIIPIKWAFFNRNRRPPKDPVNALLSLSYTLCLSELKSAIQWRGLDSALGYLHEIVPGRPSLALDLIEPLRPIIDLFVINIVLTERVDLDDFSGNSPATISAMEQPIRLSKNGRKKFYIAWHQWKQQPVIAKARGGKLVHFCNNEVAADDFDLKRLCYLLSSSFSQLQASIEQGAQLCETQKGDS